MLRIEEAIVIPWRAILLRRVTRLKQMRSNDGENGFGKKRGFTGTYAASAIDAELTSSSSSFTQKESSRKRQRKGTTERAEGERAPADVFAEPSPLSVVAEAAHNLVLIYKNSGNEGLAIEIPRRYLPVL